jgi:hypothetical protein
MKNILAVVALAFVMFGIGFAGCTEKQDPPKLWHSTLGSTETVVINHYVACSKDTSTIPPTCTSYLYGKTFPVDCKSVEHYFRNGNKVEE